MRFSNRILVIILALSGVLAPRLAWCEDGSFRVWGNRHFDAGEIRVLLDGVDWKTDGETVFVRKLQEAYIEEGFLFAKIYLSFDPDSTLVIAIDEEEVARYGEIIITGYENLSEKDIRGLLGLRSGDPYRARELNKRIDDVLHAYDDRGYPFVQIWIDDFSLDVEKKTVSPSILVVEGGKKNLGVVEIEGLEKTQEDLVIKLSGLKTGEPYNGRKLRESYLRLTTSGIFDDVAYPTVRLASDGKTVVATIRVVEPARNNSFSAALGYSDQEGRQDRILSGMVRLNLVNIGGSLSDFNAFWRNDGQGKAEVRLGLKQRFFLGRRMTFGLVLEQVGLDTLFTWQSVGVEAGVPVGRLWGGLLGIDGEFHADRNTFGQGPTANSLRMRFVGGLNYVHGNERRGTLVEIRSRNAYALKNIKLRDDAGTEKVDQVIIEAGAHGLVDLSSIFHFNQELQFKTLESDEELIPLAEQFFLGGTATVRGYREDQFHGRTIGYSRSELLVGKRLENGYIFIDAGYVSNRVQTPLLGIQRVENFIVGYGFGLRTQSRAGKIDLSFAVGEELSLQQTKVHVILNRNF